MTEENKELSPFLPEFVDGKWYRHSECPCEDVFIWKCVGRYLVDKAVIQVVSNDNIGEPEKWIECNSDGSPIAPEPAVGQVWRDEDEVEWTLCEVSSGASALCYTLWHPMVTRGHYNSPKEAVEGLTFVREGEGE